MKELNKRAAEYDVRQLLIAVYGEGRLGDPDPGDRKKAVRNHHKWLVAAETLGCHSIEVDFFRIVSAIIANGYRGYVGIAYQGRELGALEGIRATKTLLEAARSSKA